MPDIGGITGSVLMIINGQAVNSATYFDHTNHTLRLEAFSKKKDGYVIKRK